MTANSDIQISIVVACRNEIGHIREFLDSILAQDPGDMAWEAVIADGASTDGTTEAIAQYCAAHPVLRMIPNPRRMVSTGLNSAIRAARGNLIVRMDAHTHYEADYCRKCVETLLSTGADNVGGPARTKAEGAAHRAIAAAYHSRFSTGGARFHDETYEGWVDTVTYGCWKKETLERIGLFDETLVRNQDDELNLRLVRSGGKIWQNPAIVSWYHPRASLWGLFNQYFQYGFWKVMVIRKHRIPGSWRHLVPAGFVAASLGLPLVSLAAFLMGAPKSFTGFAAGVWLLLVAVYVLANAVASVLAARKSTWKALPWLPLVFGAYHFSYGLGFLTGMLRLAGGPPTMGERESVFARITR